MEAQSMCIGIENGPCSKKRRRNHNNNFDELHGHQSENCNENNVFAPQNALKTSHSKPCCKLFLTITSNEHVYESEDCKPKGETPYKRLQESVLLNVRNIEQFTYTQGSFFIVDEASRFLKVVQGIAVNLWRYSETQQRLYISRSFVFTNKQEFEEIRRQLENM